MSKEKAIETVKNLTAPINKLENKATPVSTSRTDMVANPTVSKNALKRKKEQIINKYNLKEKEWKQYIY